MTSLKPSPGNFGTLFGGCNHHPLVSCVTKIGSLVRRWLMLFGMDVEILMTKLFYEFQCNNLDIRHRTCKLGSSRTCPSVIIKPCSSPSPPPDHVSLNPWKTNSKLLKAMRMKSGNLQSVAQFICVN